MERRSCICPYGLEVAQLSCPLQTLHLSCILLCISAHEAPRTILPRVPFLTVWHRQLKGGPGVKLGRWKRKRSHAWVVAVGGSFQGPAARCRGHRDSFCDLLDSHPHRFSSCESLQFSIDKWDTLSGSGALHQTLSDAFWAAAVAGCWAMCPDGAGTGNTVTDNAWMNGHRCLTSHLCREGHKALQGSGLSQGMLQCLCARLAGFMDGFIYV